MARNRHNNNNHNNNGQNNGRGGRGGRGGHGGQGFRNNNNGYNGNFSGDVNNSSSSDNINPNYKGRPENYKPGFKRGNTHQNHVGQQGHNQPGQGSGNPFTNTHSSSTPSNPSSRSSGSNGMLETDDMMPPGFEARVRSDKDGDYLMCDCDNDVRCIRMCSAQLVASLVDLDKRRDAPVQDLNKVLEDIGNKDTETLRRVLFSIYGFVQENPGSDLAKLALMPKP
ncbi:hypothetical protein F5B20DRAFT_594642 [Whalleya microplaca]|nr:hypothetical protein F5B20DRAFT_594642 [Whalleya microplaca]